MCSGVFSVSYSRNFRSQKIQTEYVMVWSWADTALCIVKTAIADEVLIVWQAMIENLPSIIADVDISIQSCLSFFKL